MDEPGLLTVKGSRKRGRPWKNLFPSRCKAKKSKYSGNRSVTSIACTHNNSRCVAVTLTETDLSYINQQFYCTSDKIKQDAFLLTRVNVMLCKWKNRGVELDERRRQRELSIKYTVLKENQTRVPICQASLLSIFCKYTDFFSSLSFSISSYLFLLFLHLLLSQYEFGT